MNQEECKEIKQALELFLNESLERVLMSNPADSGKISRSRIRPLLMKGRLVFQAEEQAGKQAFHRNLDKDEAADYVTGLLEGSFRQAEITSGLGKALILGCGKSYLTFAMYYYLKELKGYPVRIIGLDLKEDVIEHCSRLGRQYGYDGLSFCHGDIASFEGVEKVDMVVTLHACDLATDYALEKAVNWGARVILSVPCCQHELNGQMENSLLRPVLQYGLIKERMAALYTDAIRAQVLEYRGYRTQILEFIDMEHTPKNILIRAVRQGRKRDNGLRIRELAEFLHVRPTVVELLAPELWEPREKTTDI